MAGLRGFRLDDADVLPSENCIEAFSDAPRKSYRWLQPDPDASDPDAWIGEDPRLCVSDRMMAVLERADLRGCDIEPLD